MSDEEREENTPSPHAVPKGGGGRDRVIHEYDGIQEYDNRLPNWWLYTLFATIAFAGLYWAGYHVLDLGELPSAEYRRLTVEAKARTARAEEDALIEGAGGGLPGSQAAAGPVTAGALVLASQDAHEVTEGRQLFKTYCAPCHGPGGEGKIGPNLTDNAWIHGGAPDKIYTQILNGSPTKGMIAWGPQIGPERVKELTAFVLTIKNTNVPGGKAPQGQIEP